MQKKKKEKFIGTKSKPRKNEKYVNTLMKENPEKYAQVYAHNAETTEGNEEKKRRMKKGMCRVYCTG